MSRMAAAGPAFLAVLLASVGVAAQSYDLAPTKDAPLRQQQPTTNYGTDVDLRVVYDPGGSPDTYRSVMAFDLTGIPADKVITDASLEFHVDDPSSTAIYVHAMNAAWSEGTVDWATRANSYGAPAIVSFTPTTGGVDRTIDVTATARDWHEGVLANHGLIFVPDIVQDAFVMKSREEIDPAKRPRLLVTVEDRYQLSLSRTLTVESDPIDGASNPHAIPGAHVLHRVTVVNDGVGSPTVDTVTVEEAVPAETALFVGDLGGGGSGPVLFVDGAPSSGLTYSFTALASGADDVEFSDDGGVTWSYVPIPDAQGFDPGVTAFRVRPRGTLAPESGGSSPSFRLDFRVKVD
ncbi:MAG: DNRLRE domain-containing protein [Geminicoccaceae bacterium]|nr:DNRLRE domain-containing protein [Geminicoccaceae bacterium]